MQTSELTQDLYQNYTNTSYFFTILFQHDVLSRLKKDYQDGLTTEENLLNLFDSFITEQPEILGLTSIITNNVFKIISNLPVKYSEMVNKFKRMINLNQNKYDHQMFLIFQYICRKYGVPSFNQLTFKQKIEFSKWSESQLNPEFLKQIEDKIYESFDFDFNLIYNLSTLPNNDELFYSCINNYNFLASLNYIRCNYPIILEDKLFLYFALNVLSYNKYHKSPSLENNVFGDFESQNAYILKYLSKKVK